MLYRSYDLEDAINHFHVNEHPFFLCFYAFGLDLPPPKSVDSRVELVLGNAFKLIDLVVGGIIAEDLVLYRDAQFAEPFLTDGQEWNTTVKILHSVFYSP